MVVSDFTEYRMSEWCYQILWKRFSKMNLLNEYWQNSDLIPRLLEIFEILKNF